MLYDTGIKKIVPHAPEILKRMMFVYITEPKGSEPMRHVYLQERAIEAFGLAYNAGRA
jgi:hypothetical protein